MSVPEHHPGDDLLLGYATGKLPEAFDLVIAAHLSLCDACRAGVAMHEFVAAALIETDSVPVTDELLYRTLERLPAVPAREPDPVPAFTAATTWPMPGAGSDLPAPLHDYIGGTLEQVRWRPLGMGVAQAILPTQKGARARLLRIPAGTAVPDHGHRGRELTLVISGSFSDEGGRFSPGDLEVADPSVIHTPVAGPDQPCICLAATDAPLRFSALLPRLAQPFFRI